jgi:hypothetical protein
MSPLGKIAIVGFVSFALSGFGYGQAEGNLASAATSPTASPASAQPSVETIVCIRHGEKPHDEIGQLRARGLNRALALPKVLLGKFGKPQFIFAPNPAKTIDTRGGNKYCYIRPLMTIEPTAIACGLPVNTLFGFKETKKLEAELLKPAYQNALIFVAWEHCAEEQFARQMVVDLGGDGAQVPVWDDKTMAYDAIYLIKITQQNGHSSVAFSVDFEGLNHLSEELPSPAPLAPAVH